MSTSTAGRQEKRRLWKAAERARKKIARQQTDVGALPFSVRKQCSTTFCYGKGTPLHRLCCKHRICEYCIAQLLKHDINRIQFCFTGCKGYLPTDVYQQIQQQVEVENCGSGMHKADMPPPTTAELAHRQAVARAKRIQAGTLVSQKFWVTSTEDSEGAQQQRSRHHVFFALTLGFTEHGHARVQWERSEFDDLRDAGLRSQAELSTGPEGRGGLGGMTGTHQSTVGRGTDAMNLWCCDGRGARNCIL
eukprot:2322485-Rhodomonas_salina.1